MSTEDDEKRAEELTDELARKYDPARLLAMVSKRAGRGQPLDYHIRQKYERRFGVDLSHVRVYTGEFAEEFNKKQMAHAVTIGSTGMIIMGGTAEKSSGRAAQALLGHELTHVAQQQKGVYKSSTFSGAMPFTHEHEAEAEAIEAEIMAGGGGGRDPSGSARVDSLAAQQAAREAFAAAVENVRERAIEMVGEAMHAHGMRNGTQRRA
ncbi:MAG TPA: DUF4157 domain-containing protein [Kofleriaceae bacterium]|jgi:hypothetical protein